MSRRIELGVILNAVDKVSAPIAGIGRALARIARMTGLNKVARGVAAFGRTAWRVGRVAAPALAIAAGGLVGRLIKVGDQTAKTADKLGIGVEALQRLRYAGERTGVATNTMDMALQRFTRRAAEAAAGTGEAKDALEFLGIQLRDSSGKMRPTEDLMHDVADAMAGVEDPSLRVRLAFKLFDAEGVSLVNTLAGGSKALEDMGAEATRMGLLTDEQARAAERASDNWGRLTHVVGQLGLAIGAQLLPYVDDWMVATREFLVANREAAVGLARGFIARIGEASKTVTGWVRDIGDIPARVRKLWGDVTGVFDADGLLTRLGGADVAGTVTGWLSGLAARVRKLWGDVTGVFDADGLLTRLGGADVAGTVTGWLSGLAARVRKLWGDVTGVFDADGLLTRLGGADVAGTVTGWLSGLAARVRKLWGDVTGVFDADGLLTRLGGADVAGTVTGWLSGLAARVRKLWGDVTGVFDADGLLTRLGGADVAGTVTGWLSGLAARVRKLWGDVTGVFDADGLLTRLGGADVAGTVTGWLSGLAARVRKLWGDVTGVFDADGLLTRLGGADVAGTVTGWLSGLAARVRKLWGDVTGVFDADGLLTRLGGADVAGTVTGWLSGLDVTLSKRLQTVFSGVTVGGAMTALSDSLSDPIALAGIATALLASLSAAIDDVDWGSLGKRAGKAVGDAIADVARGLGNLLAPFFKTAAEDGIGKAMGDVIQGLGDLYVTYLRAVADALLGFLEGIFSSELSTLWKDIWGGLKDMLSDLLPGPIARFLLDSVPAQAQAPAPAPGQPVTPVPPVQSAYAARGAQQHPAAQVGGEVRIRIADETGRARIDRVTSDSDEVPIDVEAGYTFADAAA